MALRAGRFRHKLTIEELVPGSPEFDPEGEPNNIWAEFTQVWGSIEPQTGREFFAAAAEGRMTLIIIRSRYFAGLTTSMRIVHDGLFYNIKNIVDVAKRHIEYEIACDEGVNLG